MSEEVTGEVAGVVHAKDAADRAEWVAWAADPKTKDMLRRLVVCARVANNDALKACRPYSDQSEHEHAIAKRAKALAFAEVIGFVGAAAAPIIWPPPEAKAPAIEPPAEKVEAA